MKIDRGWAYPDIDQFMSGEMKDDGSYQDSHLRIALAHVTDWSVAVDGGAHVGTWAKPMSGRFARVLAFEPSADTFEALTANMQAFGCTNVELHHAALGATAGAVTMVLDGPQLERQNTGGRYVRHVREEAPGAIPRITLDSLRLDTLGFLKLDVEGSEPLILEGARKTLKRCRPIVLYENKGLWRRFGFAADAVEQLLRSARYRHLERAGCDQVWGPA